MERTNWSEAEYLLLIKLIRENGIIKALDGKRFRNAEIYKSLVPIFLEEGYTRSMEQIRTKWKALQSDYRKAKENNGRSGAGTKRCPFYAELDAILGGRPSVRLIAEGGVDSGQQTIEDDHRYASLPSGEFLVVDGGLAHEDEDDPTNRDPIIEVTFEDVSTPHRRTSDTSMSSVPSSSSSEASSSALVSRQATKRKASYSLSLSKISEQLQGSQDALREVTASSIEAMKEEFERQRVWEEKQLKLSRKSNERFIQGAISAIMGLFSVVGGKTKKSKSLNMQVTSSESDSD